MEAIRMSSPQSPTFELTDPISRTTSRVSRFSLDPDPEAGKERRLSPSTTATPPAAAEKDDPFEVLWDGPNDPECPLNMSMARKWAIVVVIAVSCLCVTCCSSMAAMTYSGMIATYGINTTLCISSISFFVMGLGCGPLLLGPVSEFAGRKPVLHGGFALFFLLNFPVAFAPHIALHLAFRFLTGFVGSAFLSVSGGAITDVFHNTRVATPMMIFSSAPFLGPVLGPLLSGFINQRQPDWRWTYYVVIMWAFVCMAALLLLLPETYDPQLLKRKARRLRQDTGDARWRAPIEKLDRSFAAALKHSLRTPFRLLATEPMVLFLDLWSALILGILYLSFSGVPYIFRTQHGFSLEQTGMSFLGIGAGQVVAALSQPLFNRAYAKVSAAHGGHAPPEARLVMGMFGGVICPIGLLLLGLTAFKEVHWIVPIVLSSFFGLGLVYAYTATFTYLVDAYRPVAASALASNSFLRSTFAAGFPLFGLPLYERLGPVGATCLLAGLLFLFTPLPFIFYRTGASVRARSNFAAHGM
ncbi:MFS general substrate transporter [Cutaneotrichosporon oleaginosum]|uniref:MFS general substrate transporter n=2 Tax=Cutaneotrichosporon oleaginosum TaxID=879819 RepID=A0A0J0XDG5_9TREE|nr:MFS general substrate transporter [Cutaneotrichosporon oleaginosum]KLT39107.1 MFS general substrate transporter [Cutaneotrichosporon oleaginosum]